MSLIRKVTPKRSKAWTSRAAEVCKELSGVIAAHRPDTLVLEFPQLWAGSAKSVAAGLNGDLLKLTYLVGGLGEVGRSLCKNEPVLVTPGEWKGQLPKDVVCYRLSRVDRKLGGLGNHESDAVGMGIAAQGGL